ncbi:MAG TPA: hypothetical protein VK171_13720 [Fimbriimonas sp.]|nr:hypothetical protein [Fimbriimonas sp.]
MVATQIVGGPGTGTLGQPTELTAKRLTHYKDHAEEIRKALDAERKCLSLIGLANTEARSRDLQKDLALKTDDQVLSENELVFQKILESISDERDRSLKDLKEGAFCSRCKKSRTQLGGEALFAKHIRDVNGVREPASAATVHEAEKMFENLLFFWTSNQEDFQKAYALRAESASKSGFLANEWAKTISQEGKVRAVQCQTELDIQARVIEKHVQAIRVYKLEISAIETKASSKGASGKTISEIRSLLSSAHSDYKSAVARYDAIHSKHDAAFKRFLRSIDLEFNTMRQRAGLLSNRFLLGGQHYFEFFRQRPSSNLAPALKKIIFGKNA